MERNILMDAKTKKVSTSNSNLISTPLIMIDSISIDLINETKKIEMGNCKHFSIRGYVAEMRKKDKKLCWPFPIDNKLNKPEEHICTLPPLQTTKFRWWRCENCRREMDPQCIANEIVTIPIGNGDGVISCTDKSEKDNVVACNTCIGHVKSSKEDANQKISRPKSVAEKIDLCLEPKSCTVPLEPKCNGALVDTGKSDCGINEASANELSITKLDCQVKKQDTVSNGHASAHPSLDSNKHDCGPSVNNENLPGNDLIDDFDEDTSVSHRQKPRKIRLLSDLLEGSGNAKASHNTANSHSLSDSQSRGWDKVLNIGNEFKDKSKKRKMDHDGNGTLLEMSPFNSETRKNKISLGGSKSNYKEIDRNHHLDKNDKKKRDNDDQNHILKKKRQDVGNADIVSSHQISTGRVMEPVLQNLFPVQESGTKSSLCKKKHKKPQVENFQTVLMPWNYELLRKNSIIRQNVENKQTRPEAQAPIFSYEDFLATQQSKRNIAPFIERPPDFVLPKRKDAGSKYIGESSGPYKSTESALHDKAVRRDSGIKTGLGVKSLVSEKQIGPFRAEEQDLSASQKMDVFGKRNSEEGIKLKAQGGQRVDKTQSGQRVDKLSEQRATNDIPMEIVELLAKNQYERRLQSAEKNPSSFQTSQKPKNGEKVTVNNVRVSGQIQSSLMEKVQLAKLKPDIARKNIFEIDENVQWTNQKPVSNFPHMGLQEGSYISKGLSAFSSGVQQSAATSSSKQVGAHTSYWSSLLYNQLFHQNGKINGNPIPKPFDLNVASTEKQNNNFGSQSKINGEYRYGCSNGMGLSPNVLGSKGVYSNDTMPAMHLLSLMDPGMRSITPPINVREIKSLKAPSLQDRHLSSSVDYKKYPISETSCDCAFTSSLRNDIKTLQSLRKGKAKRLHSPKRSKILMSQDYAKINSRLPTNFECSHGKIPQKLTTSDPNFQRPAYFECSHGKIQQSFTISNPNLQSSCKIVCSIKKSPNLEICVLNRNPADFTMPGPGKTYMIGPEDLKFSDEYELTNVNGHKKQRPQELSTIEKQSHNQIS